MSRSVPEAAAALRLSQQRVRALLQQGRLRGEKVGGRWLVEIPRHRVARSRGRPMSAGVAWAALAILTGETPDWLSASERSRLRRNLRNPGFLDRLSTSEPRSKVQAFRVHRSDLGRVERIKGLVLTGLAGDFPGLDGPGPQVPFDAYVSRRTWRSIVSNLRPIEDPRSPNLVLRMPTHPWILRCARAPTAVAAADLLEHPDPRVVRVATTTLEELCG